MGLIDRYILRRTTAMTMPTLIVIAGIVTTTQLMLNIDMVTRSAAAATSFAMIGLHLLPSVFVLVLPFAVLIGALRTLAAMNADSELAVLEATGRAPRATTRPVLIFALGASLIIAGVLHLLEPAASRAMQSTYVAASADLVRSAMASGTFTQLQANVFVQVGTELDNGQMANVVLVDSTDPDTQVIYFARRGSIVQHEGTTLLALSDGQVHRRNKLDGGISIISFISSAIDLAGAGSADATSHGPQSLETTDLVQRFMQGQATGDEAREMHRRFSDWLYPLLFGAIAAYAAGRANTTRRAGALPVAAAVCLALALRAAGFATLSNAGISQTAAAFTYAVPGVATLVLLLLVATGWRPGLPRPLADAGLRLGRTSASVWRRLSRSSVHGAAR